MRVLLPLLLASDALGVEPPVRVMIQAQPRFERTSASFAESGAIDVSAVLVGDTGAPLAGADVGLATRGAERAPSFSACAPPAAQSSPRRGTVQTDGEGRLCVRVSGAPPSGRVVLRFAGDDLHLPAAAEVGLQPAPPLPTLSFESPSLELDLDQPALRVRLGLSTPPGADPIPPLEVELHDAGRVIPLSASEWSRSGATLSFTLDPSQLGSPGPARLVARLAGPGRAAGAEAIALRVATVRLGARVLADGAELEVWTETRAGSLPGGWVEATTADGGEAIASAPFTGGGARLALAGDHEGALLLHYRSDDPWWLPGAPLQVALTPSPPSAPRRWPWLALLAPIGYVCLRSLQRPAQRKVTRPPLPTPRRAELVVDTAMAPAGWSGSITDAHDGQPIAGAIVQLLLPSFRDGDSTAPAATSDARGEFELPALHDPLPEGARLRIWAPLHSEVERPLPPYGRVSVAMTSRRRAVLRRLVRWARSLGAPWLRGGEPTPGEIAELAARRGDPRTARWAEGVQAAAYGQVPVDEAVEARLRASEPPWPQAAPRADRRDG